jgi:hypothetical protein
MVLPVKMAKQDAREVKEARETMEKRTGSAGRLRRHINRETKED